MPALMSEDGWRKELEAAADRAEAAREAAEARPVAKPETVLRNVFFEGEMQATGGLMPQGWAAPASTDLARPEGQRSVWSRRSVAFSIRNWG